MIKRLLTGCLSFMLCAALLSFPALAATPGETAEALLHSVKTWDTEAAAGYLSGVIEEEELLLYYDSIIRPMLEYFDYEVGNYKISSHTAVVDLSITAPDIKDAVPVLVVEAMGYAAIQRATGLSLNTKDLMLMRISQALDGSEMTTIRTNTSLYLVMGGDGQWKLDLSNMENLHFLEALTGGLVDLAEPLCVLAGLGD